MSETKILLESGTNELEIVEFFLDMEKICMELNPDAIDAQTSPKNDDGPRADGQRVLLVTDYVDIEMPAMDGHTLTRSIKSDHDLKGLPVILCSSIITETLHHKGVSVGADDQVSKAELDQLAAKAMALLPTAG